MVRSWIDYPIVGIVQWTHSVAVNITLCGTTIGSTIVLTDSCSKSLSENIRSDKYSRQLAHYEGEHVPRAVKAKLIANYSGQKPDII